jgi:hypothetical protein
MARKGLFTDDDYVLLAEAIHREQDRRELFQKLTGVEAPADHHLEDMADLADRIGQWLQMSRPPDPGREAGG